MLAVLDDAAANGMSATTYSGLTSLASELNVSGGISCSAYVQQLANDVISGNSANAYWNGGADAASALGNLSASSSQAQFDELIGKWFLGTDLPAIDSQILLGGDFQTAYQAFNLPLWGAGGPSINDVNQGEVGDCYFLASLGEVAMQDPQSIEDMISENSNGAYAVEFRINGKADYVTVNDELPTFASNGNTIFAKSGGRALGPFDRESLRPARGTDRGYSRLDAQSERGRLCRHWRWVGTEPHRNYWPVFQPVFALVDRNRPAC